MTHSRKATVADAIEVANNLRTEDLDELLRLGHDRLGVAISVIFSDVAVSFFNSDGVIAGVAGICPGAEDGVGIVWMLCTPAIKKNPHTFVRQAKKWLKTEETNYRLLWNLADARNIFHHKLLKMLGFKAIRSTPAGPYQLPFLEIVKLCAYH